MEAIFIIKLYSNFIVTRHHSMGKTRRHFLRVTQTKHLNSKEGWFYYITSFTQERLHTNYFDGVKLSQGFQYFCYVSDVQLKGYKELCHQGIWSSRNDMKMRKGNCFATRISVKRIGISGEASSSMRSTNSKEWTAFRHWMRVAIRLWLNMCIDLETWTPGLRTSHGRNLQKPIFSVSMTTWRMAE